MSPRPTGGALFKASPDLVSRNIAGEHLLVPVCHGVAEMDYIYTANAVGSLIFRLLDGRNDDAAIARIIHEEFDVPEEQASADVRAFIETLCEAGLVQPVGDTRP
jgi:hypothetical protein